ncbi:MAG: IPTL-CTERM sorting domain-containing protein [Burkholderiaceae bacterium]
MPISSIRQLAVAAAFCCAALPAAHGQVVTNLNYNLTLTDAVLPDFHFDSGQPCVLHTGIDPTRYRTVSMTVTTAGTYNFYDTGYVDDGMDGSLGIYSGPFSVANPSVSCVASVDDDQDVVLSPGTYTLILTSLDGIDNIPGAFRYTIDGPTAVTLSSTNPSAVAPVPTLAEWSLGLLAALAAGLGWRNLRRRSA